MNATTHPDASRSNSSSSFPASGYEYLADLEYESKDAEEDLSSDDDDSFATGVTTPRLESGFEEDGRDMQALKESLAQTDVAHTATRVDFLETEQSTSPLETVSITDFLAGHDHELEEIS